MGEQFKEKQIQAADERAEKKQEIANLKEEIEQFKEKQIQAADERAEKDKEIANLKEKLDVKEEKIQTLLAKTLAGAEKEQVEKQLNECMEREEDAKRKVQQADGDMGTWLMRQAQKALRG